ncbi:MAG: fibronectin type III domain-containing protein [Thermoplasmata archaeon]
MSRAWGIAVAVLALVLVSGVPTLAQGLSPAAGPGAAGTGLNGTVNASGNPALAFDHTLTARLNVTYPSPQVVSSAQVFTSGNSTGNGTADRPASLDVQNYTVNKGTTETVHNMSVDPGSLLYVSIEDSGPTTFTISDTLGSTWVLERSVNYSSLVQTVVLTAQNIQGITDNITVTIGGTAKLFVNAIDIDNVPSSGAVDAVGTGSTHASGYYVNDTVTTGTANDMVILSGITSDNNSFTPGSAGANIVYENNFTSGGVFDSEVIANRTDASTGAFVISAYGTFSVYGSELAIAVKGCTTCRPPAVPNVAITPTSPTHSLVTWTVLSGITNQTLYWGSVSPPRQHIISLGTSANSYALVGLPYPDFYFAQVADWNSTGEGPLGQVVNSSTYGPILIQNVTQTPGEASIGGVTNYMFLNWSGGFGAYTVTWSNLPGGCSTVNATEISCLPTSGGGQLDHFKVVVSNSTTSATSGGEFYVGSSASNSGTLSIGPKSAGLITPAFWGTNFNFWQGNPENSTLAAWLNASPIKSIRLSLFNTAYETTAPGKGTNWTEILTFCKWVNCNPEMTILGAGQTNTKGNFNTVLQRVQNFSAKTGLSLSNAYFVYGNEPNLWANINGTAYGTNAKLAQPFADGANNLSIEQRVDFPTSTTIGVDMTCQWADMQDFFQDVAVTDGANISYINNQCYTAQGSNTSLDPYNMFQALDYVGTTAINVVMPNELSVLGAYCSAPNCANIRFQQGEGGVGARKTWNPLKLGYYDIPTDAAQAIAAMRYNYTVWRTWDFSSGKGYGAFCDVGLVHFKNTCTLPGQGWAWNGTTVRPAWFDYIDLYNHIGTGASFNVTFSGDPNLMGVYVNHSALSGSMILDNTNLSESAVMTLGTGFGRITHAETIELQYGTTGTPVYTNYTNPTSLTLAPGAVEVVQVTLAGPGSVPSAPTSLHVTGETGTTIGLAWNAPAGPVLNYTVYYGLTCGSLTHPVSTAGTTTSFTLTGLQQNTAYCAAVTAWNSTGQSLKSGTVTATTGVVTPVGPPANTTGIVTPVYVFPISALGILGVTAIIAGIIMIAAFRPQYVPGTVVLVAGVVVAFVSTIH